MTLRAFPRLFAALVLALLGLAAFAPRQALARPDSYSFEGYDYTEAEIALMRSGIGHGENGLSALGRRDWVTAERECRAAYDAFVSASVPAKGKVATFYIQVKACMADAYAGQQRWEQACQWYGNSGFVSLVFSNPRAACARLERSEQSVPQAAPQSVPVSRPAAPSATDYGAAVGGFSSDLRALNSASDRGARQDAANRLSGQCDRLWTFRKTNPTARGAADFCMGIVKFEQGEAEDGCQAMWMSARGLDAVRSAPLSQAEAGDLAILEQSLKGYRTSCASKGYAWPGFAEDWLHKS